MPPFRRRESERDGTVGAIVGQGKAVEVLGTPAACHCESQAVAGQWMLPGSASSVSNVSQHSPLLAQHAASNCDGEDARGPDPQPAGCVDTVAHVPQVPFARHDCWPQSPMSSSPNEPGSVGTLHQRTAPAAQSWVHRQGVLAAQLPTLP
jgi:hypothetical protein